MKILFVSPFPPWPTNVGGHQRTNLLLRAIRATAEVDFVLNGDIDYLPAGTLETLRTDFGLLSVIQQPRRGEIGPWRALRGLAPQAIDRLAHNFGWRTSYFSPLSSVFAHFSDIVKKGRYDLIVGRYLLPASRLGALRWKPIIDVDDYEPEHYRAKLNASSPRDWRQVMFRWHLRQLERIYPPRLAQCAALWVSNPANRAEPGLQRAIELPNIPFDRVRVSPNQPSSGSSLMIVGSMGHAANIEGIDWFVAEIWPRIRTAVPEAVIRIIGSNMSSALKARWGAAPGVQAVGPVQDLGAEYLRCAATVAPIRSGAGTNIKVLESYHYHRMTVATPWALRGYEQHLIDGKQVLVASTSQAMAEACIRALTDRCLRERLAEAGHKVIEQSFSYSEFSKTVLSTISRVTASPAWRPVHSGISS